MRCTLHIQLELYKTDEISKSLKKIITNFRGCHFDLHVIINISNNKVKSISKFNKLN